MKHTTRHTVRRPAALVAAAVIGSTLALGGCSSGENRLAEFRDDPTLVLDQVEAVGDVVAPLVH
ncbi:MAG: hypothetical protein AAFN41_12250, partial [Planctomycetota bacterium]